METPIVTAHNQNMSTYETELIRHFWDYQRDKFSAVDEFLECRLSGFQRPPVFLRDKAAENVLHRPHAAQKEITELEDMLPRNDRHRWFRSMKSSQALAQSVFGNLILY